MLLRLRRRGAVVDDGAVRDGVHTIVDRDSGRDERAVRVPVASADFRELAGAPAHGILMTLGTRPGVENGPQSRADVVILLEPRLVQRIVVAGRLCDTVARALRSGALRERGRVEASRRFNGRLLCGSAESDGKYAYEQGNHKRAGAPHGMNGSKTARG